MSVELGIFALTLVAIAALQRLATYAALLGLAGIVFYKVVFTTFALAPHLAHEALLLANLLGLLVGFALLANHFEQSHVPVWLPRILPDDWKGGFVLLVIVAALSSFLDNIAAALVGGTIARTVFSGRVHIAFLVAIVACANAGGAGSVVGDTTTTMMWIAGVSPLAVLEAMIGAVVVVVVCGVPAARLQHAHQPIVKDADPNVRVDRVRLAIVLLVLASAVVTNVLFDFPAAGVWGALLVGALVRTTAWREVPGALKSSVFLLALVVCASLVPVDGLPPPTWQSTLGLGFVSAVFDNIPLTKLALEQGGYDWGLLAYAVGVGGSMLWFGSSAGVALAGAFPEARSVTAWVRAGWWVPLAYPAGYFATLAVVGWHP